MSMRYAPASRVSVKIITPPDASSPRHAAAGGQLYRHRLIRSHQDEAEVVVRGPTRRRAAELGHILVAARSHARLIARRAVWSTDLRQVDFTLVAMRAAMIGKFLDGQSVLGEHGKQNVLRISDDMQRDLAFIIDITNRVDGFWLDVLLDKRSEERSASVAKKAADLRDVNACVVQTHVREDTPHVDDVGMSVGQGKPEVVVERGPGRVVQFILDVHVNETERRVTALDVLSAPRDPRLVCVKTPVFDRARFTEETNRQPSQSAADLDDVAVPGVRQS